jgi:SAM-dependent methyltransferase
MTVLYPISERTKTMAERFAEIFRVTLGYCDSCSKPSFFRSWNENFRETGLCILCGSKSRQRQIASVASAVYRNNPEYHCLAKNDLKLYNLESNHSLHRIMKDKPGYFSSEYLGPEYHPGQVVDGVRHEDAHQLSYDDCSFDLVISSDVWEHLSDPYTAHQEIFRVLKPGGHHIFTIPFYQASILDETRSLVNNAGEVEHILEPIYHVDPLSDDGILVYSVFSIETLVKLKYLGFHTTLHKLYSPARGILGNNGLVLDAWKPC